MEYAGAPASGERPGKGAGWLVPFAVTLFFAWAFATNLIDTLTPKLKGLFALTYTEAMLTASCFFLAYLVFSIPAGILLSRIGYVRSIVVGLVVMAAGCLMFSPAAMMGVYPGFLAALFVMGAGITILQVAANPMMALLGTPETSHSRLNLAQAFNSLGAAIGPWVGATVFLSGSLVAPDAAKVSPEVLAQYRQAEAHALQLPFLAIAAGVLLLAVVFWFARRSSMFPRADKPAGLFSTLGMLRHPRVAFGAMSIFFYVGAEVAIGTAMTNYLMLDRTVGLDAKTAGQIVMLYGGGAMIGRFIGSFVLRKVSAGSVLCFCALTASALAVASSVSMGMVAAVAIVAIGLFNSIMFPTIFTLSIEGRGEDTPKVSSLLCMSIVGGAVIPLLTGRLADQVGLQLALLAPAACYVLIALYGLSARRPVEAAAAAPAAAE